jgi:hypothetical protein
LLFADGTGNLEAGLEPGSVREDVFQDQDASTGGGGMKTIHKYSLDTTHADKIIVMMPRVAQIVMVGSQQGQPFLWAIVDTESPLFARHYRLIATGQPIPGGHDHVASFTRNNGESTWHLFE